MRTYDIEIVDGEELLVATENGRLYWIPKDPANSDYQRYLRWLENPDAEEGGTL